MIEKLQKLKLNDIVYISDLVSLRENNVSDKILSTVNRIMLFTVKDKNISYKFIEIKKQLDDSLAYIVVAIAANAQEVGLYFKINEFPQGDNRQDLLSKDIKWLFQEPKSNNFKPCDLEFTECIDQGEVKYNKIFPTIYGSIKDDELLFCSLSMYHSSNDLDNRDVILLEIGGLDDKLEKLDCGGSLHLMHGRPLQNNDVEILLK
jgi:hypothetical protein